jgi:signal transduction histidine kinase
MRGLERVVRLGWRWSVLFVLVMVLPTIALTLLSFRAFQGEASRAAFQRRERQQQLLRLLENDLREWVLVLRQQGGAPDSTAVFEVTDSRVFFPRLNVHLSAGYDHAAEVRLTTRESALWLAAQAAERGGAPPAPSPAAAYRELLTRGPPLAPWARLALLRLALQQKHCAGGAASLAAIRERDLPARTESGIPIWVAGALLLEDAAGACPSSAAGDFIAGALAELQGGRWPLTAAQWSFYARELLQAAGADGPLAPGILETARFLESFESALPQVIALHQSRDWRQSSRFAARYVPDLRAVLVLVPDGDIDGGRVLSAGGFLREAQRRLDVLTSAEDFGGTIALQDGSGRADVPALPAFPFLQVSFAEKSQPLWRAHLRRYLVFYLTGALLLIAAAGLVLIYRTMMREAEISRMKAEFVASVSHEFRTPLSAIDALLERLESGRASNEEMRQRYYRASRREVHRLTRMVNQLLALARLNEGRTEFAREPFDLNEPVEDAVQSFVDLGLGGRLAVSLETERERRVIADRTATYQCIHNLIDNAVKYSPKDSTLTVRTGRVDGMVFVEVEDHGPGIPAAEQPLVFEQFYRGRNAQSGGVQGAGIGLAFVKKVVEAHGGQVSLRSRPGEGSTFRLSFPEAAPAPRLDGEGDGRS